jgi:hypothetical protein
MLPQISRVDPYHKCLSVDWNTLMACSHTYVKMTSTPTLHAARQSFVTLSAASMRELPWKQTEAATGGGVPAHADHHGLGRRWSMRAPCSCGSLAGAADADRKRGGARWRRLLDGSRLGDDNYAYAPWWIGGKQLYTFELYRRRRCRLPRFLRQDLCCELLHHLDNLLHCWAGIELHSTC